MKLSKDLSICFFNKIDYDIYNSITNWGKKMGKTNVIVYTRVSSIEQTLGYSLAGQETEIVEFARKENHNIIKKFIEKGESAKTANRTELSRLLEYSKKNHDTIDFLIVWKFDRLARNLDDQLNIIRFLSGLKIRILSVTENNDEGALGNLIRNILGSVAQYENEDRAIKSKMGMIQSVREGRWVSNAPLGYKFIVDRYNKKLLVPDEYAPIIKSIFVKASSGIYNTTMLFNEFKSKIPNLSRGYLSRIIKQQLYMGVINSSLSDHLIKGIHEPIITEKEYWLAQKLYKNHKMNNISKYNFVFNNFVYYNGRLLSGGWCKGKTKKYIHYRTSKYPFNISGKILTNLFIELLNKHSFTFESLQNIEERINQKFDEIASDKQKKLIELDELENITKRKKNELEDYLFSNVIDKYTYKRKKEVYNSTISDIVSQRDNLKKICNKRLNINNETKYFLCNLSHVWENQSNTDQQRIMRLLYPNGLEIKKTDVRTPANSFILSTLTTSEKGSFVFGNP